MIRVPAGWLDLAAAAIVCVSAFWIGGRYVRIPIVARYALFNQDSMGPSVTIACGRGFRHVDELPTVQPFLLRTVDSFDCAQLPVRLDPTPLTPFQSASRYLLTGVGWVWAVTGVSWTGLWVLFAGLYAVVGVLTFYAARILFGRWLSLALTALLVISSTQLSQLPNGHVVRPFDSVLTVFTAPRHNRIAREAAKREVRRVRIRIGRIENVGNNYLRRLPPLHFSSKRLPPIPGIMKFKIRLQRGLGEVRELGLATNHDRNVDARNFGWDACANHRDVHPGRRLIARRRPRPIVQGKWSTGQRLALSQHL